MASKALVTSLLLTLNLIFITKVSSCPSCPPSTPPPPPPSTPKSPITPTVPTTPCPPPPSSSSLGYCPIDALMLGVCANVLDMFNVTVGSPPTIPCCSLITSLIDLEAAACLCTALKANVLGINLNIPVSLSLILNNCGKNNSAFQCN